MTSYLSQKVKDFYIIEIKQFDNDDSAKSDYDLYFMQIYTVCLQQNVGFYKYKWLKHLMSK